MDRQEALDVALGQIERQFGKGSVMKMNDRAAVSVGAVSTGSLALDLALGDRRPARAAASSRSSARSRRARRRSSTT